ncbi:MAG: penicillin-binding protein activator [Thermodesulfobacteriota bacterium]
MMRKVVHLSTILTVVLAAALLGAGCLGNLIPKPKVGLPETGPAQPGPVVRPDESEMLRRAEVARREGDKEEALRLYEEFLRTYPDSSDADSALAALGQINQDLDRNEPAIIAYEKLVRQHPQSGFVPEVNHRLAGLYLEAGRYDEARDLLTDMLAGVSAPEEQARLRVLLGRAYLGQGNRTQSMDLFLKAYNETSDRLDKEEAQKGVKASIALMTLDELPAAQTQYAEEYPGGWVTYVLAYRLFEAGRIDEAEEQLGVFFDRYPNHEMTENAKALLLAIKGEGPKPPLTFVEDFNLAKPVTAGGPEQPAAEGPLPEYKSKDIAVLLPLSETEVSTYGRMVLDGLKLALKTYQPRTPGFRARLLEYDTQGRPETALALLEKAAAQENVLAVVGPLLSKVAVKAGPKAESLGLPMLAVSQWPGLPKTGRHVFRIFLTPKAQAEAVAMYSVQVLGLTRLAVLYPDEAYGREMRDYFQDEVRRLGGQIVSAKAYNPKDQEYSAAIEQLSGVGKAARKVGAGRKARVPFEAVFLPDSYNKVAMIAPQFAFHDITTLRFLGTSLWHTPNLLSSAARYVQGCVVPTAFFAGREAPEVKQFLEAFRAEKGDPTAEPTQFEAYGYDAGMLLLYMMDRRHVATREELVQALGGLGPFPGVTGRFNFDQDGEYKSEPILLTVEGTEFKPVQ